MPEIEIVERELALHSWAIPEPIAIAFYIHGTQSHAGWLFDTGPALNARGVTVYALDRRGSGRSGGTRGDSTSWQSWVDDYAAALAVVRARHGQPLTIIGQSMGAPIATLLAARAAHDAVLFSAPALDTLHATRTPEQLAAIRAKAGPELHDITTPLEAFTHDERYLDFMRRDPLRQRQMSSRFFASWIDAEVACRALPDGALAKPCCLLQPRADRVVDGAAARRLFERLTGGGTVHELPTDEHYLELSSVRHAWYERVAAFATSATRQGGG